MIPEAAVEAVAKVLCEMSGIPWNPYLVQNHEAQAALEATAPHFSSAWHDAVSSAYVDGALSADQANVMYNANPYRPTR